MSSSYSFINASSGTVVDNIREAVSVTDAVSSSSLTVGRVASPTWSVSSHVRDASSNISGRASSEHLDLSSRSSLVRIPSASVVSMEDLPTPPSTMERVASATLKASSEQMRCSRSDIIETEPSEIMLQKWSAVRIPSQEESVVMGAIVSAERLRSPRLSPKTSNTTSKIVAKLRNMKNNVYFS